MAYPDYQAVLDSSLYQGEPVRKAILSRIAYLTRDNTQPKGWCTAGQQYLADQVGCSVETVQKAIAQFRKDGIVEVKTIRKANGWKYNRYRIDRDKIDAARRPEEVELPEETDPEATRTEEGVATRIEDGEEDNFDTSWQPPVFEPGRPPVSEPTRPPVFNAEATRTEPGHSSYLFSSYLSASNTEAGNTGETPEPPGESRQNETGEESEPKREAHTTHVCISEPTGEIPRTPNQGTASLRPANGHPREHVFNGTDECQFPGCKFVCRHRSCELKRVRGGFAEVCRECRMEFSDSNETAQEVASR